MVTGSSALTGSDALTGSESKCDDALTGGITTMRSDALTGGTPAPTGGTTNTATGSSVADNRGRAAIFDLDGTLLDSMGVWDQIDAEFLAKRGIAVPDDYMAKVSAMQFRQIAEYTIARFGLDDTPQALVEEWNGMAKRMYAHVVEPKPHAVAYLRELKESGAKLAVATTMLPDLRAPALAHAGMADLFDAVVGVDDAAGRQGTSGRLSVGCGHGRSRSRALHRVRGPVRRHAFGEARGDASVGCARRFVRSRLGTHMRTCGRRTVRLRRCAAQSAVTSTHIHVPPVTVADAAING